MCSVILLGNEGSPNPGKLDVLGKLYSFYAKLCIRIHNQCKRSPDFNGWPFIKLEPSENPLSRLEVRGIRSHRLLVVTFEGLMIMK